MRAAQDAALELFAEHGFEAVTVERVADAAGISVSTLYRHFGTKERLVLWDEIGVYVEEALRQELGKHAPFEALRRAFVCAYSRLDAAELALLRRRTEIIDATPPVLAALVGELDDDRVALQRALAVTHARSEDDLEMELAARIALSALIAGIEAWQRASARASLPRKLDAAFRAAVTATRA